jgi:hypothetical protein
VKCFALDNSASIKHGGSEVPAAAEDHGSGLRPERGLVQGNVAIRNIKYRRPTQIQIARRMANDNMGEIARAVVVPVILLAA